MRSDLNTSTTHHCTCILNSRPLPKYSECRNMPPILQWCLFVTNFVVISDYCKSNPGDSTTILPTSFGRQIGTVVNLFCASGYMAGSNNAPVYLCFAGTTNSGSWLHVSGSCVGEFRSVLMFINHKSVPLFVTVIVWQLLIIVVYQCLQLCKYCTV